MGGLSRPMSRNRSKRVVTPPTQPSQHKEAGAPLHGRRLPVLALAALLALAATWTYAPSFRGVLVLDDVRAIVRNPSIRSLWPLDVPLTPPTGNTLAGRPVANLTFAVNYALAPTNVRETFVPSPTSGDGDPFLRNIHGYHAVNLLVHACAALVLFGIIRRTLGRPAFSTALRQQATPLAFLAALLWTVHPLQSEAVTYVVQRVESLMSLWYLLTVYAAIRVVDVPRRRWWWACAGFVSCALGMGTKEVMVTAPLVVAAWYYLFGETDRESRRWQAAMVGVLGCTWPILVLLVVGEHRAPTVAGGQGLVWQYLLTQAAILVHYLRLAFVPWPLVFLYTWPLVTSVGDVAPALVVVAALVLLTAWGIWRRHPLSFAGAVFFLVLAPTSSLLPIVTEVAAEHRMYLPLAAVIAPLVVLVWMVASRLAERVTNSQKTVGERARSGALVATCVVVLLLAVPLSTLTRARNEEFWSEEGLWADTVAKQPSNQRARVAYGMALASAHKMGEAERELRDAVALEPTDPVANGRLGSILAARGQFDEAAIYLERALAARPGDVDAHRALGQILAMRHQDADAVRHLEQAVAVQRDPSLLLQLASLRADSDDPQVRDGGEAVRLAQQAIERIGQPDPRALNVLSASLAAAQRFGDAVAAAEQGAALARARGEASLAAMLDSRAAYYRTRAR